MLNNTFKGRDRRLMEQTWRNLRAIILRDQKAWNPKITTTLSTRDLILDNNNTPTGTTFAAGIVLAALRADCFLPGSPPAYSGTWPPPVGS